MGTNTGLSMSIIKKIKKRKAMKAKELIDKIIKEQTLRERGVIILDDYRLKEDKTEE